MLITSPGRDAARELARHELHKQVYAQYRPNPVQRAYQRLLDWAAHLLDRAGHAAPGGRLGLAVLVALAVVGLVLVLRRLGPVRRSAVVFDDDAAPGAPLTSAELRAEAQQHAEAGRYDQAIRSRLRAVARRLEERGLLEPRAGRTADELAAEAAVAAPEHAVVLRRAALAFDEVWYGERPATPERYGEVAAADEQLSGARAAR